jgi:hypothetical protein
VEGEFVWTNFPFGPPGHDPTVPGPSEHIAYVLGHRPGAVTVVMLAYTSSGPWRGTGGAKPVGVLDFDRAQAARVNQKPFHVDLRCLARVALNEAWFTRLSRPGRGVVALADQEARDRITREAARLARVAAGTTMIEIRGIRG